GDAEGFRDTGDRPQDRVRADFGRPAPAGPAPRERLGPLLSFAFARRERDAEARRHTRDRFGGSRRVDRAGAAPAARTEREREALAPPSDGRAEARGRARDPAQAAPGSDLHRRAPPRAVPAECAPAAVHGGARGGGRARDARQTASAERDVRRPARPVVVGGEAAGRHAERFARARDAAGQPAVSSFADAAPRTRAVGDGFSFDRSREAEGAVA